MACDQKLQFSSKAAAKMGAERHGAKHDNPQKPYYCSRHMAWHLTSVAKS